MAMEYQAKLLADLTTAISSMNAKLDILHPIVLELNQYRIGVERVGDASSSSSKRPSAALLLGAQYDLDASATTGATTTFAATAVSASITSPPTRSLACSILSTGTSLSIPASTRKDAREVFESMPEPFGQSQDVVAVVKKQKDAWKSAITFTIHLSTWYKKFLISCVPCSVLLHILMAFEKQRRVVSCDLCLSWPLHVQANFSDWLSIWQLDLVPLFPWNPGCYSSGSRNQINMVFPVTIRGSHWLVPSVCDGPTLSSPFEVLCDEWILPPWDSGNQADVSYDRFSCANQYTWLPGYFFIGGHRKDFVACSTMHLFLSGVSLSFRPKVMCELQLARSGSPGVCLQEQQIDGTGIGANLNNIGISRNVCQLKWSESILAYRYCSILCCASASISCERKMRLNSQVIYMVERCTDVGSSGIKTDAILSKIMSVNNVWFFAQMDVICLVQPDLLLTKAYQHSSFGWETFVQIAHKYCIMVPCAIIIEDPVVDWHTGQHIQCPSIGVMHTFCEILAWGKLTCLFNSEISMFAILVGFLIGSGARIKSEISNKDIGTLATSVIATEISHGIEVICRFDTTIHHVICASRPCITPCPASGTISKTASSNEFVLGKKLYAPWDPGGHVPLSLDDDGLRASRMLRRGECHGPCVLQSCVAWAVARNGLRAQGIWAGRGKRLYLKLIDGELRGAEEPEPEWRTLAREDYLFFLLISISRVSTTSSTRFLYPKLPQII